MKQLSSVLNDNSNSKTKPGLKSYSWRLLRCVLLAYLVVLLAMVFFENYLIYLPAKYPAGNWQPGSPVPEEVDFQSADGTKLHGWYLPHSKPHAVVLYSHGNAGNIANRLHILRTLNRLDASVMLFDYRGYGKSEGSPNEAGVIADARAARAWLAKKNHLQETDIILIGRSLGGAVAVDLAAKDGAAGLVLESTFTSLPDVAQTIYPWLPVKYLMRNQFQSQSIISNYQGPLLQSHARGDEVIPYRLGKRLFDTATCKEKQFFEIRGGHNDPPSQEYYSTLREFFKNHGIVPGKAITVK